MYIEKLCHAEIIEKDTRKLKYVLYKNVAHIQNWKIINIVKDTTACMHLMQISSKSQ